MPKKVTKEDMKNAAPISGPEIISQGVTAELLRDKLLAELEATKVKAQIPKGKQKFAYSKPMIDWKTRQEGRMDAHKLRGDYPAEKSELDVKFPNAMALVVEARQEAKKKRAK